MRDPYNPLPDDLRAWAYTDGAVAPEQDWDLIITNIARAQKFIEFVTDLSCPNALFFLKCLYLLVGDAVRTKGVSCDLASIQKLLDDQKFNHDSDIQIWVKRSHKLIQNPALFQYDDWCAGGLANDPERIF